MKKPNSRSIPVSVDLDLIGAVIFICLGVAWALFGLL
jgi:hypothetical protein